MVRDMIYSFSFVGFGPEVAHGKAWTWLLGQLMTVKRWHPSHITDGVGSGALVLSLVGTRRGAAPDDGMRRMRNETEVSSYKNRCLMFGPRMLCFFLFSTLMHLFPLYTRHFTT